MVYKPLTGTARNTRPNEVRLAVDLPLKVHRQLKARAAAEGRSIREYILTLLKEQGIG